MRAGRLVRNIGNKSQTLFLKSLFSRVSPGVLQCEVVAVGEDLEAGGEGQPGEDW